MQKMVITTENTDQTRLFGSTLGAHLKGGEVIELIGDVGAGKTSFVTGLAAGAGSDDRVSSPTFTVTNVYNCESVTIHHYDFYRLDDVAIMQSELAEVMTDPAAVLVIEWAGSIEDVLPAERMKLDFVLTSENGRSITMSIPSDERYANFK